VDGALILSVVEKLAPGSSHSGVPVALTTGLPAGSAQDVAPVALVRVAPFAITVFAPDWRYSHRGERICGNAHWLCCLAG
jgi:hypothetical protein